MDEEMGESYQEVKGYHLHRMPSSPRCFLCDESEQDSESEQKEVDSRKEPKFRSIDDAWEA